MRFKILIFYILPVFIYSSSASSESNILITNAWISEAPPSVPVHAGYLTIRNTGAENIKLISVESNSFSRIEIHKSYMEEGIAKMRKQESLAIPANSEISLAPGNFHIMLFDSDRPLKAGDHIPVGLMLSNGEKLMINMEVKRLELHHKHYHH